MKKILIVLTGFIYLGSLFAGIRLKMDTRQEGSVIQSGWIYAEGEDWLRIDVGVDPVTGEADNSMLFHAADQTLFMIDHSEKAYMRLDRHSMEDFSKHLDRAMQQMQEQLENLPEGQRKVMEDMLKKNMPQSADFEIEVKEVGMEDGLHKFETWIGGEKRSEVWVQPVEKVGLAPNSLVVFKKLSAFYEEMLSSLANNPLLAQGIAKNPFPGFMEMNGLPVRILHLEEGVETRLTDVQTLEFSKSRFQPPSDYQERSIAHDH